MITKKRPQGKIFLKIIVNSLVDIEDDYKELLIQSFNSSLTKLPVSIKDIKINRTNAEFILSYLINEAPSGFINTLKTQSSRKLSREFSLSGQFWDYGYKYLSVEK